MSRTSVSIYFGRCREKLNILSGSSVDILDVSSYHHHTLLLTDTIIWHTGSSVGAT